MLDLRLGGNFVIAQNQHLVSWEAVLIQQLPKHMASHHSMRDMFIIEVSVGRMIGNGMFLEQMLEVGQGHMILLMSSQPISLPYPK